MSVPRPTTLNTLLPLLLAAAWCGIGWAQLSPLDDGGLAENSNTEPRKTEPGVTQLSPLTAATQPAASDLDSLWPALFRPVAAQDIRSDLETDVLARHVIDNGSLNSFLARPEADQPVARVAAGAPKQQIPDPTAKPIPQPVGILDPALQPSSYQQETASQEQVKPGAQEPAAEQPPPPATPQQQELEGLAKQIESRKQQVSENKTLDESAKTETLSQLNAADSWIQKAQASRNEMRTMTAERDSFNERLEKLKSDLAAPMVAQSPDGSTSEEDLGTVLQQKESELLTLQTDQREVRSRVNERESDKNDLPGKRTAIEEQIRQTQNDLSKLGNQPESATRELSRLVLESKLKFLEFEIERLALKSTRLEQEGRTLPLRRDLLGRKIKTLESEIEAWRSEIEKLRQQEIARQKREAAEAMEANNELLRELAQQNQALALKRENLNTQLKLGEKERQQIIETSDKIEDERADLKEKIEIGLTVTTGILLVEHRRSLMPAAKSQNRLAELTAKVHDAQASKLILSDHRDSISTTDEAIDQMIDAHADAFKDLPRADARQKVRALLETQLKLADALLDDYSEEFIPKLNALEQAHRSLINNIQLSREFTTENALWVRSANPISLDDLADSTSGVRSFLSYNAWKDMVQSIANHISTRPYEISLLVLFVGGLFMVQRRLKATNE